MKYEAWLVNNETDAVKQLILILYIIIFNIHIYLYILSAPSGAGVLSLLQLQGTEILFFLMQISL